MANNPDWMQKAVRAAAAANKVPMVLADAQDSINENRTAVKEKAARQGVRLYVPTVMPRIADGSETYPTVLASLLCANPQKAQLTNDQLMREVSGVIGLNAPLSGNRMSKKFSTAALERVRSILVQHGYGVQGVQSGTDVKRAVRDGKQQGFGGRGHPKLTTAFEADGVVLDGTKYLYRQRERAAIGMAWHDLCIRVAGADVPLSAALKLRGFGIGEFDTMDKAAIAQAEQTAVRLSQTPDDEIERQRAELDNLQKERRSRRLKPVDAEKLDRLQSFLGIGEALARRRDIIRIPKNRTRSKPEPHAPYPRVTATELVRAYWAEISPVGQHTSAIRDLAGFFQSIMHDPVAMKQQMALVEAWRAREDGDDSAS